MDLKRIIKENYRFVRVFAIRNDLSAPRVQYWISKDWKTLNYSLRLKIRDILLKDGIDIANQL